MQEAKGTEKSVKCHAKRKVINPGRFTACALKLAGSDLLRREILLQKEYFQAHHISELVAWAV